MPAAMLGAVMNQLRGAGSTLRLSAITMPEVPDAGALTGTMTIRADGSKTTDPPSFGVSNTFFLVFSGPCTISDDGRCVGRAEGYLPNEACAIVVGGGGGVLGPCNVFDTEAGSSDGHCGGVSGGDYVACDPVTLPDGSRHGGSDCPAGVVLVAGDNVGWHSNSDWQGSVDGPSAYDDNGCATKGTCGLPFRNNGGLGGGWQICFR